MNYYEIGQRIRKYRKAQSLSQEQLADMVDISVTHMSHIETGNTKLSLAVFEKITIALGVQSDMLLFGNTNDGKVASIKDIQILLDSCSGQQVKIIAEIIKTAKVAMDMYQ